MNHRLLTSAVAIHATACIVAFFAVGPGEAGANAREVNDSSLMRLNSISNSTQSSDDSLFSSPIHSRMNEDVSEEEWAKALPVLEMPEMPAQDPVDQKAATH